MIRVGCVALVALLLVSGVAGAAAPKEGWFVGAAAGSSSIDDKAFRSDGNVLSTDDTDTAWQVWGGYRLASWVAMQGRYVSLGEFSAAVEDGNGGSANSTDKSQGLTVDMKLIWPIGASGIDLYAQLGLGIVDWEADLPAVAGKPATSLSAKEPLLTYGAGVRWTIVPALTLSLAVDAYQYQAKGLRSFPNPNYDPNQSISAGNSPTTNETYSARADILTPSIGLQYNF